MVNLQGKEIFLEKGSFPLYFMYDREHDNLVRTGLGMSITQFSSDYDDNSINAVRSIDMEPIQWDVDVSQINSSACGTRV